MAIVKLSQNNFSIRVMIFASVFLLLLASGVSSIRQYDNGYPKYDQDTDIQDINGYPIDQAYNMMNYIQELLQRSQMRRNPPFHVYNFGEDMNENLSRDKNKNPLLLLNRIRNTLNEGMVKAEKRKVNISLCNFKVCNYG